MVLEKCLVNAIDCLLKEPQHSQVLIRVIRKTTIFSFIFQLYKVEDE